MGQSGRHVGTTSARRSSWLSEAAAGGETMCGEAPETVRTARTSYTLIPGGGDEGHRRVSADGETAYLLASAQLDRDLCYGADSSRDVGGTNDNHNEANEDEEIFASSSLRPVTPQYTKLEVMTAQEIRCVLILFYIAVVIGFIVTISTVAFALFRSRLTQPVFMPVPSLLSESQYREGLYQQVLYMQRKGIVLPGPAPSGSGTGSGSGSGASSSGTGSSVGWGSGSSHGSGIGGKGGFTGSASSANGAFGSGGAVASSKFGVAAGAGPATGSGGGSSYLPSLPREIIEVQANRVRILPERDHCGDAGASYGSASSGALPSASDLEDNSAIRKYANQLADAYSAAGRGPDSPKPFSFSVMTYVDYGDIRTLFAFDFAYIAMASASLFAFIFALVYIARIVRLGWNGITYEQIWAACLLILTALYWSFFYALSRVRVIGSPPLLPKSFDRIDTVSESLRMPAFTGIIFFYTWAFLHKYRILDPTQHLGFISFYLPKFAVLIPFVFVKAFAWSSMDLEISEIPFISAIALVMIFSEFQVWRALRPQLVYLVLTSIMEMVIFAILTVEAVKTSRALRHAEYTRYRTKQTGFRFFARLNVGLFIALFANQLLLLFALPGGEAILPLVIKRVQLRIADNWLMGSVIMMFGYVIAEAYVKLPTDAAALMPLAS